jgi:hypothetical protein
MYLKNSENAKITEPGNLRPFEDFARRTDLLDPPAAQNANPVAERQCFVLVVGDGKERRSKASVQPTYLVAKLLTQPFV